VARYIPSIYDQSNNNFQSFLRLIAKFNPIQFEKWYFVGGGRYVYQKENGFLHMVLVQKTNLNGHFVYYSLDDHLLTRKHELMYHRELAKIKTKAELDVFIQEKVA